MRRARCSPRAAACLVWVACAVALAAPPAAAGYPYLDVHPNQLKFPALRFAPPEPTRRTLPNGMVLYLLEDRELPLFSAIAYLKTGAIYEPADKVGLAGLTGTVMHTGGSGRRTGDEIDEALEFVGGSLEVSIGQEFGTARVSTLQKDADIGLEALAEVLRQPAFRQDKLELAKQQAIEGIRRKNDQPGPIADRLFAQAIYGKESPWAREPSIAGIRSITREDVQGFHARTIGPNNIILAAAGDMSVAEMTQRIQRWFGDWQQKALELPAVPPVPDSVTPGVVVVPKDTTQANIRIGHLGIRRHNPDRYAIRVMNEILGMGELSRLMREVRATRGLAYAVWGYLGEGRDRGPFELGAETKIESTQAAISAMRATLEELIRKPIPPSELAAAKNAILNSFVFRFRSRFDIVSHRAELDVLGFGPDYLTRYPQRIAAVTAADVQRVARKYLHPNVMVTLVVGPPEKLQPALARFGPVRVVALEPPQ